MKVSIGHFFGKCFWLFLFFYICLNGHEVNGQTVGIENVVFREDLSAFNLTTCFSSVGAAIGLLDVSTEPDIFTQSASGVPIFVTANPMCQSHVIPIAIVSDQLGTEVTVKIAASSTIHPPVSVDVSQSSRTVTIPVNQQPTVQCPADFSVTAPPLSTSTTALFNTPQCLDNQQANFLATCTPSSGSLINVGLNTVTCTCTDIGGLTVSCTFTITVQNPCLTQPCDVNATCTHNEGLVKCTCREGFYGDGTTDGTGCTGCPRNVPDEKFGLNCSSPCTCASNADCNLVSGDCFGVECGDSKPQTCDKNNLNVMIIQDDMDVDEKTAITLFCTVNLGTADVNVTWINPAGAEVQSGTFLTVSNAGKEDSGTYTCIAQLIKPTDSVTNRTDSVNINVRVPEEVPDLNFNNAAVTSTSITVTLSPVSIENGPISCYEIVVAERVEDGIDPDEDFPFSDVKENSNEGTPYRAVVMNHDKYTAQKTVIIGAEGNQESTCELPGNSRRKRALELVSSQTLTARNDPLESAKNYSIFLRIYVLSTNGEYWYSGVPSRLT